MCLKRQTRQRLITTQREFQSGSFEVNLRGPVGPGATSAVIHKSETILFQSGVSPYG